MDTQSIDQQFAQLQGEAQQTVAALQALGGKLQAAAQGGDQQAREWLLDLRELALSFRSEQDHVSGLLQSMHALIAEEAQARQQSQAYAPAVSPQPATPAFGGWGGAAPQGQPGGGMGMGGPPQGQSGGGGLLGSFLGSSFGRAIETGAGFGIGDDLIKEIF